MLNLKPQQFAMLFDVMRADRIANWAERPLTAIDELVWRTLYYTFMNHKTGACWPSLKTLALHAGCSRRTACTSIQRLRKAGWLRWQRRWIPLKRGRYTQAPNEYELKIPRRWRRSIHECKACARTTRLLINIGTAHLLRPKKGVPMPVKVEPPPLPKGYGHNRLRPTGDPHIDAQLASMMKLYEEREEARNAARGAG
jgi:Helix-turn-helix domain